MSEPRSSAPAARRSQVLSWALWDFGATGLNAVVVTFVFSIYLTNTVGDDLPGDISPTSWLGWALGAAGLAVALLAPVTGVWVDAPWRRRRALAALSALAVVLTLAMSLIRDDYRYLALGLVLVAAASACSDLATRALQRDAASAVHAADIRPDLRIRFGAGVFRQRRAAAGGLLRVHLRRR